MAADSFHHQMEMSLKRSGKFYDFHDFEQSVMMANSGKVNTKTLGYGDLFNWVDFTSYHKLKNMGDARPYLNNIVKVKVETVKYSTKYEEAAETEFNFLQA